MSEIKFEIGDRVVGSVGYVSGKATEQLLWFMPDVPVDDMPHDFGQWAVLNTELDVVED